MARARGPALSLCFSSDHRLPAAGDLPPHDGGAHGLQLFPVDSGTRGWGCRCGDGVWLNGGGGGGRRERAEVWYCWPDRKTMDDEPTDPPLDVQAAGAKWR